MHLTNLVVEMIVVSTGGDTLSPEAQALFDDLLEEMNTDGEEMVTHSVCGLEYLRARLASETGGARIDLTGVAIENWGSLTEPYLAYYGVVDGSVLKDWYDQHGEALFSQNIRKALGQTAVNNSLHNTVSDSPEKFWYFNNGVTVLCERISKSALGASSRNFGEFDLVGASVVNGAQTVASVAGALGSDSAAEVGPKIWIRAISLEGCPEGFAADVTRATNTQNSVESRDFVSLDEEQVRLRTDFRLSLSKVYSIKRGEAELKPDEGCTVTEAALALACRQKDVALAVIAKSAPGRLWDMQGRYYRQLFNPATDAYSVWRSVLTLRWVDAALEATYKQQAEGRPRAVNAQGRRVVLWAVFRHLDLTKLSDPDFDWQGQEEVIENLAKQLEVTLYNEVEAQYGSNYVTSLFKNTSRCKTLGVKLVPAPASAGTSTPNAP